MAGRVDVSAKSFVRVGGASHVGHAGIVGNVSDVLDEFKDGRVVSSVARPGDLGSAVKNVLDREVNVVALGVAGDLDAVRQAAQGSVGPTRTTILGQVLVERVRQIGYAINVSPGEGIGEGLVLNVGLGERLSVVVTDFVPREFLQEAVSTSQQKHGCTQLTPHASRTSLMDRGTPPDDPFLYGSSLKCTEGLFDSTYLDLVEAGCSSNHRQRAQKGIQAKHHRGVSSSLSFCSFEFRLRVFCDDTNFRFDCFQSKLRKIVFHVLIPCVV